MQQAIFTAHCPYELGDIVEVAIIEGMAITGYPEKIRHGRNADNGYYHGTQLKEWHGIIYLRIGR